MLLPLTFSSMAIAQDDFQKIFEEFKKATEKEFADFRDKANSDYSDFLRKNWESFEGHSPMVRPASTDPVIPPKTVPQEKLSEKLEERELTYDTVVLEPEQAPVPDPIENIIEPDVHVDVHHQFKFYGTDCDVRYDAAKHPLLTGRNKDAVADYWDKLSSSVDVELLLYDILELRKELALCDWAYYKLTEQLSHSLYPDNKDEASVFQAYLLTQSGFRLRIGYSKLDEGLHFIIATECKLYEYPYWELDSGCYYLLDGSDVSSMSMVAADFEGSQPMRMAITKENAFSDKLSEPRSLASEKYPDLGASVQVNVNLMDFYNDYPQTVVNNDSKMRWRFYATVPISNKVKETLYPSLKAAIAGKTELEAVELLLNFVQTAFPYENDDKLWGGDRVFYADECLYYPYCDCEDRSILFSRIIRDLLGMDVVLIYYPGHLATAVKFNETVSGDYISYKGSRYMVCDPTYINASVGMTMPDFDNSSACVIVL